MRALEWRGFASQRGGCDGGDCLSINGCPSARPAVRCSKWSTRPKELARARLESSTPERAQEACVQASDSNSKSHHFAFDSAQRAAKRGLGSSQRVGLSPSMVNI